jgi:hypothetical protein
MPDRAGIKLGCVDSARFIVKFLPSLPKMYSNRPSVVDPRVYEVGIHIYLYHRKYCTLVNTP